MTSTDMTTLDLATCTSPLDETVNNERLYGIPEGKDKHNGKNMGGGPPSSGVIS